MRRYSIFGFVALACASSGAQCGVLFPGQLSIEAVPTGCGTKISDTKTISWLIKFTAAGVDAGEPVEWTFEDGTSGTGRTVVKAFDTVDKESGTGNVFQTDEHDPVTFAVTVTAGGQSVTQSFEIPMRGELDGGDDPFGDSCVADDGRTHVVTGTQLCYASNPPASGPHYSEGGVAPVAPGFYDEAVATERWVHNLEHGSIVLLYDCDGTCSDDLKTQLQDFFDSLPASPRFNEKKMVITRYAGVHDACGNTSTFPASGPFLAIGWGVQRSFSTLDTDGIIAFYQRHVDHGPEDAPIPTSP